MAEDQVQDDAVQPDDRHPVEVLADEFLERKRRGDRPTIEEYAEAYPDIAEDIRGLFPTILAMERLKDDKVRTSTGAAVLVAPKNLERLGDFKILGEIGRGGMGIVYEAEQRSLGRFVAVKVLPKQTLLDGKRLARFEREAQMAAKLHHTNIVPIFGVGDDDGLHYYVMQFIRGVGLDEIVKGLRLSGEPIGEKTRLLELARQLTDRRTWFSPEVANERSLSTADVTAGFAQLTGRQSYWQSVAALGVQVAEALHYAHGQGTLHRDVKPANLLLDKDGVVWVTDFGLAKAIEQGANLTHSGDMVGTLQYMAPEQFHGQYDEQSEIYCLGLTLYELLALQPAFVDRTRSGLLHKVSKGEPTRIGRLSTEVPRDLETIVQKAIAREPKDRYRSAGELADDLHSFLLDRPIRARRLGAAEQLWRWCRRNKALASALLVAFLAIVSTGVVGWIGYVGQTVERKNAEDARKLAESNLERMMRAFDEVFDRICGTDITEPVMRRAVNGTEEGAENEAANPENEEGEPQVVAVATRAQPTISQQNAAIMESLIAHLMQFAEANTGSEVHRSLRERIAKANYQVGDMQQRMGRLGQATASYEKALQLYNALNDDVPESPYAMDVLSIHNKMGYGLKANRQEPEAKPHFEKVISLLEANPSLAGSARGRYEKARAHAALGAWVARPPRSLPRAERDRIWKERRTAALVHRQATLELTDKLLAKDPNDPAFQLARARACRMCSVPLEISRFVRRPDVDEAMRDALRSEAIAGFEALAQRFPRIAHYRYELAETLLQSSRRTLRTMQRGAVERATRIMGEVVDDHPTVPEDRASLVRSLRTLGGSDIISGNLVSMADGIENIEKAVEHQKILVRGSAQLSERQMLVGLRQLLVIGYDRVGVDRRLKTELTFLVKDLQDMQEVAKSRQEPWPWQVVWLRNLGSMLQRSGLSEELEWYTKFRAERRRGGRSRRNR